MKKSTKIQLIVLGTAVLLGGCDGDSQDVSLHQNSYNSLQECKRDWNEGECQRTTSSHGSGFVYVGPRYYWDSSAGHPMAVSAATGTRAAPTSALTPSNAGRSIGSASVSVSRGGFGSSAHAASGGGHASSSGG